jgi:hypothetical protein
MVNREIASLVSSEWSLVSKGELLRLIISIDSLKEA